MDRIHIRRKLKLTRNKFKKNKDKKYIFSVVFMILLILLTGYFIFRKQSFSSLIGIISNINVFYVLIGFAMMFVYLACEALGIKVIMKSLGQKVSFMRGYGYSFVGFYFSSITPSASGGHPVQIYYMRKDKINISYSSLTMFILAACHQIVAVAYAAIMFVIRHQLLSKGVSGMEILVWYGILSNIVIIGGIFIILFSKTFAEKIVKISFIILSKVKLVKNLDEKMKKVDMSMHEYKKGAKYIKRDPLLMIKVMLITIAQVTAYFIVPYFVYKAFNLKGYGVIDVLAVQSILTLAVSSLPLPGAVGASETAFLNMFKMLFAGSLLIPAMLISRILNFYSFVVVSGVITFVIHIRQVKRNPRKRIYRIISEDKFDPKKYMVKIS